eukprot:271445-Pleurochrysis_carterae.AAC.2
MFTAWSWLGLTSLRTCSAMLRRTPKAQKAKTARGLCSQYDTLRCRAIDVCKRMQCMIRASSRRAMTMAVTDRASTAELLIVQRRRGSPHRVRSIGMKSEWPSELSAQMHEPSLSHVLHVPKKPE